MKRFILGAVLLMGVSLVASAGFYSGLGFGVRPLSADFSKFTVMGVKIDNLDESVTKPAVDLFVGYEHVFNHGIYLAGEAFYEYVDMNTSAAATVSVLGQAVDERVSASLNSNFGISTLFGYQATNKDIFYGRLGILIDELHYSAQQTVTGISDTSTKGQHYAGAVQVGLGMIHPFNDHWRVRGEYTYTRYPNVDVDIPVTVPTVGTGHVKFTPKVSINAATVSLIYAF